MKYLVVVVIGVLLSSASASAQEEVGTVYEAGVSEEAEASEPDAPEYAPQPQEEKRSVYYKKVQGWLWIEGFVGPTSFDPDSFIKLDIGGPTANAPKVNGAEGGFAILLGLGGFGLGFFYRQANYDTYKLLKTGLDMQGIFRFVPYVHPMVRIDLGYAQMFKGNPYGLTDFDSAGFVVTLGAGLRIPIIRWMSFAATFDWSLVGLVLRGVAPGQTERGSSGVLGQQLGATFALTFHFIGVRKNN